MQINHLNYNEHPCHLNGKSIMTIAAVDPAEQPYWFRRIKRGTVTKCLKKMLICSAYREGKMFVR